MSTPCLATPIYEQKKKEKKKHNQKKKAEKTQVSQAQQCVFTLLQPKIISIPEGVSYPRPAR
jgi:hypothetical protein